MTKSAQMNNLNGKHPIYELYGSLLSLSFLFSCLSQTNEKKENERNQNLQV